MKIVGFSVFTTNNIFAYIIPHSGSGISIVETSPKRSIHLLAKLHVNKVQRNRQSGNLFSMPSMCPTPTTATTRLFRDAIGDALAATSSASMAVNLRLVIQNRLG